MQTIQWARESHTNIVCTYFNAQTSLLRAHTTNVGCGIIYIVLFLFKSEESVICNKE